MSLTYSFTQLNDEYIIVPCSLLFFALSESDVFDFEGHCPLGVAIAELDRIEFLELAGLACPIGAEALSALWEDVISTSVFIIPETFHQAFSPEWLIFPVFLQLLTPFYHFVPLCNEWQMQNFHFLHIK